MQEPHHNFYFRYGDKIQNHLDEYVLSIVCTHKFGAIMQKAFANPLLTLDHIAVAARSLDEGLAHVEAALGVAMPAGGEHREMGTHNHLLRLGDGLFLEVIAINPAAPSPPRARWFDLDRFGDAAPRLATWIVRTDDLGAALAGAPDSAGAAIPVSRGELTWHISVPQDGSMPFDGAYPTTIEWQPGPHPASHMPDLGFSLLGLKIEHPDAVVVNEHLGSAFDDARVDIEAGPQIRLTARIATPQGVRILT